MAAVVVGGDTDVTPLQEGPDSLAVKPPRAANVGEMAGALPQLLERGSAAGQDERDRARIDRRSCCQYRLEVELRAHGSEEDHPELRLADANPDPGEGSLELVGCERGPLGIAE